MIDTYDDFKEELNYYGEETGFFSKQLIHNKEKIYSIEEIKSIITKELFFKAIVEDNEIIVSTTKRINPKPQTDIVLSNNSSFKFKGEIIHLHMV